MKREIGVYLADIFSLKEEILKIKKNLEENHR